MANNYIKLGSETLIDLRSDTVATTNLLSGFTAHDASGAAISGGITSGTASIALTPSELSKTVAQNKYVTNATASLDYSSLTAAAGNVAAGKTFIGSGGLSSGTMTPVQVGYANFAASGATNGNGAVQLTDIVGAPTNCIIIKVAQNTSDYVSRVWKIGSDTSLEYNGFVYRSSSSEVTRNGTVTITQSGTTLTIYWSAQNNNRKASGKYQWVVW